jgi:tetratricopeptide (TPR) repeat protein
VDHEVGQLLAALPSGGSPRLVAVVGDHGEALGEHGEKGHGIFLYRASLEVPLILEGSGVPKGRVVADMVATRGLAATLLRLLGLRQAARDFGPPLPGLPGSEENKCRPVYSETLMPATAFGWSALKAISQERWRLIVAPRPELYDFVADPAEARNRLADRPDIAARLRTALDERERAMRPRQTVSAAPDPDVAASLRSLGYVSGASATPDRAVVGGIDPKDGILMLAQFEEAKQASANGKSASALRTMQELVQRSPRNVPFLSHLAQAQFDAGLRDQAIETYRKALALNPALDFLHVNLAEMLVEMGRAADARREYEAAVGLNPRLAKAWMGLAELAMREDPSGSKERGILLQAVDAGTESGIVLTRLAQLDEAAGDQESADRNLRRATELAAAWGPAWLVWGDLAERQGRVADALERYRRAYEAEPTNSTALLRAGRLLVKQNRVVDGRSLLERAVAVAPGSPDAREARRWLDGLPPGR